MRMHLSVTVLFCAFITAACAAHARTWEFWNGTRIDGKFVRLEGNDVRLRVGRDANLYPFARFSVTDQEFIRYFHMLKKFERDKLREEIDKHPERVWTLKNGQQWRGCFLRFFRAELSNGAVVPHVTILPIQSFPYAALLQKDQIYVRRLLEELGIAELLEPRHDEPARAIRPHLDPYRPDQPMRPGGEAENPLAPLPLQPVGSPGSDRVTAERNPESDSRKSSVGSPSTPTPSSTAGSRNTLQNKKNNSLKDDILEGNWQELPENHGGQLSLIVVVVVGSLVLLKVLRG